MKSIWKLNTISTEKVSSYNLTHKITNFPKGKSPKMICYQLKNIADDRKWFQSQSMHILDMENILLPSIYWQYLKPFIILCNSLFGTGPECDDVSGGWWRARRGRDHRQWCAGARCVLAEVPTASTPATRDPRTRALTFAAKMWDHWSLVSRARRCVNRAVNEISWKFSQNLEKAPARAISSLRILRHQLC